MGSTYRKDREILGNLKAKVGSTSWTRLLLTPHRPFNANIQAKTKCRFCFERSNDQHKGKLGFAKESDSVEKDS